MTLESSGTRGSPWGHPIKELFGKVSLGNQTAIRNLYDASAAAGVPEMKMEFDNAIENSSGAFEYFRYFYEKTPSVDKGWTASYMADAVAAVILGLRPAWK